MTEPTKKRGGWRRGQSGNPSGMKPGTKHASTKLRKAIEAQLPEVIDALLTAARAGDVQAASVLLSRSLPPLRPTRENVVVAGITADSTPAEIALAITRAAAAGRLPADVAADLAAALVALAKLRCDDDNVADLEPVRITRQVVDAAQRPFRDRPSEDHE